MIQVLDDTHPCYLQFALFVKCVVALRVCLEAA